MASSLERIPVDTIDGRPSSLGAFAGKVRLVVDVASRCGLTPPDAALIVSAIERALAQP